MEPPEAPPSNVTLAWGRVNVRPDRDIVCQFCGWVILPKTEARCPLRRGQLQPEVFAHAFCLGGFVREL